MKAGISIIDADRYLVMRDKTTHDVPQSPLKESLIIGILAAYAPMARSARIA
jgi:hypothetical protein